MIVLIIALFLSTASLAQEFDLGNSGLPASSYRCPASLFGNPAIRPEASSLSIAGSNRFGIRRYSGLAAGLETTHFSAAMSYWNLKKKSVMLKLVFRRRIMEQWRAGVGLSYAPAAALWSFDIGNTLQVSERHSLNGLLTVSTSGTELSNYSIKLSDELFLKEGLSVIAEANINDNGLQPWFALRIENHYQNYILSYKSRQRTYGIGTRFKVRDLWLSSNLYWHQNLSWSPSSLLRYAF